MFIYPDLIDEFREFEAAGLVISPWLAGVNGNGRFDASIFEMLDEGIRSFAIRSWTEWERLHVLNDLPSPEKLPRTAMYEIVASTAVLMAHERTGGLEVDELLAAEALEKTVAFAQQHGFSKLLQLYMIATSWENQNAIAYYGSIPEREFLPGHWHRPWVDYDLGEELLFGTLLGNYRIDIIDGHRFVALTDEGRESLRLGHDILEKSGYLAQRLRMLRISQLSRFTDYEQLSAEIWPNASELRREFLDWSGIEPGMRVLELGCANGVFTFAGGLAERVGPTGHIIGIDPSAGMIKRAWQQQRSRGVDWAEFRQARAEELPFDDGVFDAAIGVGFLHFTDLDLAAREMRRVTKPGGIVASFHPLKSQILNEPAMREWFLPILELKGDHQAQSRDFTLFPEQAPQAFKAAELLDLVVDERRLTTIFQDPDKVIRHFMYGVGWLQEELSTLPWKAREDIIETVRKRGKEIGRKYPPEELVSYFPMQMLRGTAPKALTPLAPNLDP